MSIMVAAADLGIGSAHSAVADQDLARRLLGFPEDRFCAWLISLGVPADRPLADPAAQPAPVHRRRAPRPLVAPHQGDVTGAARPWVRRLHGRPHGMDHSGIHPACAALKEAKYVHWPRRHRRP